jgi:hypothetical protein
MTPEERIEHRKKMRDNFEKMPPEERRKLKHGMGKHCDMPPEDCPYNQPDKD